MSRILSAITIVLLFSSPALAWHTDTHLQMTQDMISLMPADFKQLFVEHQKFVEAGIVDPDEVLKDWQNHYYIPATAEGGALDRIDKLIQTARAKLKSGAPDAVKQLCYLAHYIADLWTPESLIQQHSGNDRAFFLNHNIMVFYEGYEKPIEEFHIFFHGRSEWRWRLENSSVVFSLLYSEAVNDIARTWLTLWQQNGKTVESEPASVLEHKAISLQFNPQYPRRILWGQTWYQQSWSRFLRQQKGSGSMHKCRPAMIRRCFPSSRHRRRLPFWNPR